MPFTINEIGLIELPIVGRLQKVCGHIARIENRSFVVLSSFPLTFDSLISVSRIQSNLADIFQDRLT